MIVQKDVEKPAFSCFSGVGINALWKPGQFHINVNTHLLYDLAVPVLGICPREEKIYIHSKICTQEQQTLSPLLALKKQSARRSTPSRKWVLPCEPGRRPWAQMRPQLLPTPCSRRDPGQRAQLPCGSSEIINGCVLKVLKKKKKICTHMFISALFVAVKH